MEVGRGSLVRSDDALSEEASGGCVPLPEPHSNPVVDWSDTCKRAARAERCQIAWCSCALAYVRDVVNLNRGENAVLLVYIERVGDHFLHAQMCVAKIMLCTWYYIKFRRNLSLHMTLSSLTC